MANELNTPEVVGEVPPEIEIPADEAPAEIVPEEEEAPPTDEAPDADALKADIERLQKERETALAKAESAKRKEAYWRRQREAARKNYERQPPPAEIPKPQAATTEPKEDDFDDYTQYSRALADWTVDQKKAQWDREEAQKQEDQKYQEKMIRLDEEIGKGFEKYEDFAEVALDETVPITPLVKELLAETDNPADVAYFLGKNHSKAIALCRMTPMAAAREIAKIELAIAPKDEPTPPKKKHTSAPPPIKPAGSTSPVTKDPEKMTQAEYNEYRLAQGAKPF